MKENQTIAIYSGTFDPITMGHVDIAVRASKIFDKVIISVSDFPGMSKKTMFSVEERVFMAEEALSDYKNIEVRKFDTLLVDFVSSVGAKVIVRGIRSFTDFEYEEQLNGMNSFLAPDIETVYLTCSSQYSFVSSSLVKEVAFSGRDVAEMLPKSSAEAVRKKLETGKTNS